MIPVHPGLEATRRAAFGWLPKIPARGTPGLLRLRARAMPLIACRSQQGVRLDLGNRSREAAVARLVSCNSAQKGVLSDHRNRPDGKPLAGVSIYDRQ